MVPRWLGTQRGLGVGTDPLNWPPETSPLGASLVGGWGWGCYLPLRSWEVINQQCSEESLSGNAWAGCDGGRNRDPRDTLGLIRISLRVRRKMGAVRGPGATCVPWSHHGSSG